MNEPRIGDQVEHALERETDGEHALHRPVADVSRQEVALFDPRELRPQLLRALDPSTGQCVLDHLRCDRPEEQPEEPSMAASAHHQELSVLRLPDQHFRGRAPESESFDRGSFGRGQAPASASSSTANAEASSVDGSIE